MLKKLLIRDAQCKDDSVQCTAMYGSYGQKGRDHERMGIKSLIILLVN